MCKKEVVVVVWLWVVPDLLSLKTTTDFVEFSHTAISFHCVVVVVVFVCTV